MTIYIFLIIVISFFIVLNNIIKKRVAFSFLFIVLSFLLLALSAFRNITVGGDLINYIPLYERVSDSSLSEILNIPKYGILYLLYNKLLAIFDANNLIFMIGTSCLNLIPIIWLIIKYSKNTFFSIFLYVAIGYYTNTFNSVRSSMAIAITVFAIPFIIQRKFYPFLFLYILAICTHLTSFPLIIAYWLFNVQLSFKRLLLLVLFSCIISEFVSSLIMGYLYLYDPIYDSVESSTGGYSYFLLLLFFLLSGYCIKQKCEENIDETKRYCVFLKMMLIAVCIQPIAFHFMFMNRVVLFFSIYIVVFIPNVIHEIKSLRIRLLAYVITYSFFAFFFFNIIMAVSPESNSNGQMTIPYSFFWE